MGEKRLLQAHKHQKGDLGKHEPMGEAEKLVTNDVEKAELLGASFPADFTGKISLQEYQAPEARGKVWNKEDAFSEGESS